MNTGPKRLAWMLPVLLLGCAVVLNGCATTNFVRVRRQPENPLTARLNYSILSGVQPTDRTLQFLESTGYEGGRDVRSMLLHCRRQTRESDEFSHGHSLAELQYLAAEATQHRDPQLAMELALDAARDAWGCFARPDSTGMHADPADPVTRDTAELYNASVELLLRLAQKEQGLSPNRPVQLSITGRQLPVTIPVPTVLMDGRRFGNIDFVSDYEVRNLRNRHTRAGLGVPLIIARRSDPALDPLEPYYTQGMSLAATAVLRFEDSDQATPAARLELYDPGESDGLAVNSVLLPLETDTSTPLARFLSNPDLSLLDTWGLIRPDLAERVEGLYMVQPYDPDRIPVLMVHGFWSSPLTWMEMFNDLQADPEIRRRYQFWFYLYPTGESVAFAAARLRDELQAVRQVCDPQHENARFDQMVVVGHSMGGVLAHMLTINSGDVLWNSVSRRPVEQLRTSAEKQAEIRRVFFFRRNESVGRIVTIASPWEGSSLANQFTRRLLGSVIWLPSRTMELSRIAFDQTDHGDTDRPPVPRTSLDSLSSRSPLLRLVRETSVPPEVRHHNIIAISRGRDPETWTDGVVSWNSAHRSDVSSETLIRAGHSQVVRHPDTAREIRRILLQHLIEQPRGGVRVIPVRHSEDSSPPADDAVE
ncbi:MAG: esterase/lipase family protein [Planctomycetota bacterium]